MHSDTDRLIRKIYGEIVAGYSFASFRDKVVYIKHVGIRDTLEYDFRYQKLLDKYVGSGVVKESEKIEYLTKENIWTADKEKRVTQLRDTIAMLQNTKRNHFSLQEIEHCNAQIKQNHSWLIELITEKAGLIGETAESMARRNIDAEQIIDNFFTDGALKNKLFDSIENVERTELADAFAAYEKFAAYMDDKNIRRVSLCNEFQSNFALTDNLYYFFGIPIAYLTQFQSRLVEAGHYYKSILSADRNPPENVRRDPDKLDDWLFARSNVDRVIAKDESSGKPSSLFGITAKELEYLGVEVDNSHINRVQKLLAENGGELSGDALRKISI